MGKHAAKKIIQVPIEDSLLRSIDEAVGRVAECRAAFIRDACRVRLETLEAHRLDQQYADGYRRKPQNVTWAKTTTLLRSRVLPTEKW